MYVLKRDGRKEEVHFDKITARIKKLTYGLNDKYIDPVSTSRGKAPRARRVALFEEHPLMLRNITLTRVGL